MLIYQISPLAGHEPIQIKDSIVLVGNHLLLFINDVINNGKPHTKKKIFRFVYHLFYHFDIYQYSIKEEFCRK